MSGTDLVLLGDGKTDLIGKISSETGVLILEQGDSDGISNLLRSKARCAPIRGVTSQICGWYSHVNLKQHLACINGWTCWDYNERILNDCNRLMCKPNFT